MILLAKVRALDGEVNVGALCVDYELNDVQVYAIATAWSQCGLMFL